jgi:hypothetical protein
LSKKVVVMARPPKYDWTALYNEFITGGYRTITAFAEVKGIHPFAVHREFRKLRNGNGNDNNGNGNGNGHGNGHGDAGSNGNGDSSRISNAGSNNGNGKPAQGPGEAKPEDKTKQNPGVGQNKTKSSTERRRCAAISHKTGQRCRQPAMFGSDFCRWHADAIENQCTARSKQTGQRCKKKAVPGKKVCKFHGANGGVPPGRGIQNNLKHGIYARFLPEELKPLLEELSQQEAMEIIKQTVAGVALAIARAQHIMHVKSPDDDTRELVEEAEFDNGSKKRWEIRYAPDKYATFLHALAKAGNTLNNLVKTLEQLEKGDDDDGSLANLARVIRESRERAGDA